MKVNILGTVYTVKEEDDEFFDKYGIDGYCEWFTKEIYIRKGLETPDETKMYAPELYKDNVILHEIIHAFFFEAGMQDYDRDERLTEWMARNIRKIINAFDEAKLQE